MNSRAHLLIQRELNDANKEPGLSVTKLNENSLFELVALIQGLPHSSWENGIFKVYLKFTEQYNLVPPSVYFQTIPFHPNVSLDSGKPSLDFLDAKKWRPDYHNIKYILKSLQYLLANPYLDRAVNMEAVFILKDNPNQYESIVKQSVLASQKLMQNSSSHEQSSWFKMKNFQYNNENITRYPLFRVDNNDKNEYITKEYNKWQGKNNAHKNISFEEYANLWKGIATTKSNSKDENAYLNSNVFENPAILFQHLSISLKDLEKEVYKQLSEHKNLMYGNFDFSNKKTSKPDENGFMMQETQKMFIDKAKNVNEANKYNMAHMQEPSTSTMFSNQNNHAVIQVTTTKKPSLGKLDLQEIKYSSTSNVIKDEELFEKEVDDLINWTKNI